MDKKYDEQITEIAKEAARIKRDYPELNFKQALEKAKEVYKDGNRHL